MTFSANARYTCRVSNFILDVDTGEDDALAILLAARLGINLKLIVSSYGNSVVDNTTRNTVGVVALSGLVGCPVFKGASRPIEPHLHFLSGPKEWESAEDFLGGDGLCGIVLPTPPSVELIAPPEQDRVQQLATLIKGFAPVHYIATGPYTNLAELCRFFGQDVHKYISKISLMGGALNAAGNSGPRHPTDGSQYAEFNFYCDPFAADIVLRCGVPVHMVAWDSTRRLTIPLSQAQHLKAHDAGTRFIKELIMRFFDLYGLKNNREFEFNDPAAVWLPLFAPEQFCEKRLETVLSPAEFGKLIETPGGTPVFFHSCDEREISGIINELLKALQLV
jgi:inosine-uridine nucleoside N-ribohydrolase